MSDEPISAVTGGPLSKALYCCLCFKVLRPSECNVREDGTKEDVCVPCAKEEAAAKMPEPE